MLIGVALARILGPDQFGTFAVAWVAVLAVLSLNDLGVSLAIVRWPEEPDRLAPTVNTVTAGFSLALAGLMVTGAGPFARALGDPSAAPLVRWLAVCVILDGLVATPAAILQRTFQQGRRMVADQANVWTGALLSIGLAVGGYGASSIVFGRLAGSVVSAVLLFRFSPVPYRFAFDRSLARRLARFGLPLAAASVLVFGIGFIDQLVVGHQLGPRELAFYVQAFNLASWPVSIISGPLRNVAPALFARLRVDPADRLVAFNSVLRLLAAVALPTCVGIAAAAPQLVAFVYGERWTPTAEPLRWLALYAILRIFFELTYDYVVVAGSSVSLLVVQGFWLTALVPAVTIGAADGGTSGVALAVLGVGVVVIGPIYGRNLMRLGVRWGRVGRELCPAILASLLLYGGITALGFTDLASFVVLALSGIASLLVLGGLLWTRRRDLASWRTSEAQSVAS